MKIITIETLYYRKLALNNQFRFLLPVLFFFTVLNTTLQAQDYAVDFNGSNQYGQIAHNDALKPDHFTIEAWAKADVNNSGFQTVFCAANIYNSQANRYGVLIYNHNSKWELWWATSNSTAPYSIISSPSAPVIGKWTHLAATYDGTNMRFYVDGVLIQTTSTSYGPDKPSGGPLYIGADYVGDYFNGQIDRVRIWNAALSQATIQQNALRVLSPTATNLVANYELDEGSGTTFANSCTNVGTFGGTLANNPAWVTAPKQNLHLKTDAGLSHSGGNVTGWTDQTSINNFTLHGTPGYVADAINFHPAVSFSNSNAANVLPDNRLQSDANIQAVEALAVFKTDADGASGSVIGSTVAGSSWGKGFFLGFNNGNFYSSNGVGYQNYNYASSSGFHLADMDVALTTSPFMTAWINGSSLGIAATGSDYASIDLTPVIGGTLNPTAGGFTHFNGQLAEVLLYTSGLSSAERSIAESYLAIKYGIHLPGNYVNSSGSVIWNATTNAAYHHDVFGIARDDATGLNQTKSNSINTGSGNGTGQSGKANIVLDKSSGIGNNEYFLLGHDNGALTFGSTGVGVPHGEYQRLQRVWKISESVAFDVSIISMDFTGLNTPGSTSAVDYMLLIDSDTDFSDATDLNYADTIIGSTVTFQITNLSNANGKYLTIAAAPESNCTSAQLMDQGLTIYSGRLYQKERPDYWKLDVVNGTAGSVSFNLTSDDGFGSPFKLQAQLIQDGAASCGDIYKYEPGPGSNVYYAVNDGNTKSITWAASDNIDYILFYVNNFISFADNYSIELTAGTGLTQPVAPGGVAGTNLWYNASEGVTASGSSVSDWANQGSISADAAQSTAANQPTLQSSGTQQINFNPTIGFDGSNDYLQTPTLSDILGSSSGSETSSQFVVYRRVSQGNNNNPVYIFGNGTNALNGRIAVGEANGAIQQGLYRFKGALVANEVALIDMMSSTSASSNALNYMKNGDGSNVAATGGTYTNQTANTELRIGGVSSSFAAVDIAEIAIYPSVLNAADRNRVQSYLALKYGISLGDNTSAVAYTNSSGSTIWAANATYKYDIFGIGKDDGNGLNQTQSNSANTGSGDGTGQSGKGNIVLSNPSSLEDGDFLILGHDNGALTEQTTDLPASLPGYYRLAREWKVNHTNDVGTVTLKFSTLGLTVSGNTASDFKLIIDTDGNGDFTNGTVTEVNASGFANDEVTFNAATLPNDAVFTLVTSPPVPYPGGVAGANLWYNASEGVTSSGSSVSDWANQGSIAADAAQATAANQPTLQSSGTQQINFNPTIGFDGSNDVLATPAFSTPFGTDGNGDFVASQFIVYRSLSATDGIAYSYDNLSYIFLGAHTLGRFNQGGNRVDDNEPVLQNEVALMDMVATSGPSVYTPSLNKNARENQTINIAGFVNATNLPFRIGRWFNGMHAHADIAEIVIYPAILNAADRNKVQSYLALKYGVSLGNNTNAVAYTSSAGSTIWAANATYKYDIFGIGKDDASGLDQTQSNSANTGGGNGTGQSGKGNIVLSNPGSLDNGDFLIIGHDNAALAEQTGDLPLHFIGSQRLSREWKVKHTGDAGDINLAFDLNGLTFTGTTAADFRLLVDVDGDGDFTTGPLSEFAPATFASGVLDFTGIIFPDEAVFTFVTQVSQAGGVPGASFWLLAEAGIDTLANGTRKVNSWQDQSSSLITVSQNALQQKPNFLYNANNFYPAVQFEEIATDAPGAKTNDWLGYDGQVYDPNAAHTLFMVDFQAIDAGIAASQLDLNGNANNNPNFYKGKLLTISGDYNEDQTGSNVAGGPASDNTLYLNSVTQDASLNVTTYRNGLQITTGPHASVTNISNSFFGGANAAGHGMAGGNISEYIIFPSLLSETDRLRILSYLAIKYGITLDPSVGNYVNASGAAVWDNTAYWHDVFGIGEDDLGDLIHSISNSMNTGSGDGSGKPGEGNIVISNPSSMENGDFLMIGNDGAAFTEQTGDIPLSLLGRKRLGREWKAKHTGDIGTVSLRFDMNGITVSGTLPDHFRLIVDTDGDGNFETGPESMYEADSLSNSLLYFSGITLPDSAVFTFVTSGANPGGITNGNMWLKGNTGASGTGTLASWTDQLGINNFTVSGDPQTGTSSINFNNTVDFDGSGDFLTGDNDILFQTLYAVIKRHNSDFTSTVMSPANGTLNWGYMAKGDRLATGNNDGLNYFRSLGSMGTENARIAIVEVVAGQPATAQKTYIDGTFYSTVSLAGTGSFNPFGGPPYIGRSENPAGPDYFNGQIAELVMFGASHDDTQRLLMNSYLAIKYGVTLDPAVGLYVSSASVPLWDNTSYWNDVFGIGRDNIFGLIQTSSNSINSGSGNGTGQSGKGNIVLSNPSSLGDGDFIMTGHDNAALTNINTGLPSDPKVSGHDKVERQWKVKHTGDAGTIDLSFEMAGIPFTGLQLSRTENYTIMVDLDGDGDFSTGTVNIVNPTTITGSLLEFEGITLPDGAVFTFSLKTYKEPFVVFYTTSGDWQDVTWEYDLDEDNTPDYPAGTGVYPKLNVAAGNPAIMSDNVKIKKIQGASDRAIIIDGNTLPEARNGRLGVVITSFGSAAMITLKNFNASSFSFGHVNANGGFTNTDDPATPLTIDNLTVQNNCTIDASSNMVTLGSGGLCQFYAGTHQITGDASLLGNPTYINGGASLTITGNLHDGRLNVLHNGTLIVNGNANLENSPVNVGYGNNYNNGPAIFQVDGDITETSWGNVLEVRKHGQLTVGGSVSVKTLTIDAGGAAAVAGNIELSKPGGALNMLGPADATYGHASLDITGDLTVTQATGNKITMQQDAVLSCNNLTTPHDADILAGAVLNILQDLNVLIGSNFNVWGTINLGP